MHWRVRWLVVSFVWSLERVWPMVIRYAGCSPAAMISLILTWKDSVPCTEAFEDQFSLTSFKITIAKVQNPSTHPRHPHV
ncbi:uncharacterized protein EI90DRAFT_3047427 [Cantharellus anzutake]|uniref:uncharacterized protein n=1 Tax=Cantharellus anzutake TaxID=1750568 RepID=UPI0019042AA3|nr:uncharacterized protein EI90DRAFT_3047427 [Cantharellus anzutake]KAF8335885.1 hypothetical protein EI90DRAFT_3047427 [Cantharellus anzutake]